MDDLEYVIDNASRFERFLEVALDARGDGLNQKVRDVKHLLPDSLFDDLLYIARIRNLFAHGEQTTLRSRDSFEGICRAVELDLFSLVSLNDRSAKSENDDYSYSSVSDEDDDYSDDETW